jgi:phenylacetate-CoA ligase
MTSLSEERAEQERWRRLLRGPVPDYDRLLEHEFETPDQYSSRVSRTLGAMLRFAFQQVPYYRRAFRRADIGAIHGDPARVLASLPVLTKLDVHDAGSALKAERLPPGELLEKWWRSSGTTGRPLRVLHSARSARMFNLLAQRGCRWHRLHPAGTFAEMRLPSLLPRRADGAELRSGETARLKGWRSVEDFATGPWIGLSVITPVEEAVDWLRREKPDYLMTYPETLEFLAMAAGDEAPAVSLKAVVAISEQLTPSMRTYIERRFGTPVHQVYGLSEIGLAAGRCDGGRYHVHREHCLVEIVDDEGRACPPGDTGRVLITSLTNYAMPLIRYDTGDLAQATAGKCPCNRTLPSFGEIVGRYSRIAFLPQGTLSWVAALRGAIEGMPTELARDLRQYQIHQFKENCMEVRVLARAALPDAVFARLRAEWDRTESTGRPELRIRRVDEIPRLGKKAEVFTSDFMPARDDKPPAGSMSGRTAAD